MGRGGWRCDGLHYYSGLASTLTLFCVWGWWGGGERQVEPGLVHFLDDFEIEVA